MREVEALQYERLSVTKADTGDGGHDGGHVSLSFKNREKIAAMKIEKALLRNSYEQLLSSVR